MFISKSKIVFVLLLFLSCHAVSASEEHPSQDSFKNLICKHRREYRDAANEVQKTKIFRTRVRELRTFFENSLSIKNWRGVVREISTTTDSKVSLEVSFGCGIKIGTWNNALSDMGDFTLIDIDSEIAERITSLSIGQKITFSGNLIQHQINFIREKSITEQGAMIAPEFLIEFTDIIFPNQER